MVVILPGFLVAAVWAGGRGGLGAVAVSCLERVHIHGTDRAVKFTRNSFPISMTT